VAGKKRKVLYFLTAIVIIVAINLYQYFYTLDDFEYCREYSPDNQYSVYIRPYKRDFMMDVVKFPFQKYGDRSGKIFLYDEIEKKIITSAHVDMIGFVDVEWTKDRVYTKGDGGLDKSLPRKISNINY